MLGVTGLTVVFAVVTLVVSVCIFILMALYWDD